MEKYRISLIVPSSLENLALLRALAKTYLQAENVSEKEVFQLLLVLDELATNAIEHAYEYSRDQEVKVSMNVREGVVYICVEDFGSGFKKEGCSKEEGGMGLVIVRNIVDSFEILKKELGTKITVSKVFKEADE